MGRGREKDSAPLLNSKNVIAIKTKHRGQPGSTAKNISVEVRNMRDEVIQRKNSQTVAILDLLMFEKLRKAHKSDQKVIKINKRTLK